MSLLVGDTLWKNCFLLILRIFIKFFLFKFSLLFYGFPLQVTFILCNCVQSVQWLKAFSTKYFLWLLNTPDKFNQKQIFKSFCSKYQTDFSRKACVCALFFFFFFTFSLSVFLYLKYEARNCTFVDAIDFSFWIHIFLMALGKLIRSKILDHSYRNSIIKDSFLLT